VASRSPTNTVVQCNGQEECEGQSYSPATGKYQASNARLSEGRRTGWSGGKRGKVTKSARAHPRQLVNVHVHVHVHIRVPVRVPVPVPVPGAVPLALLERKENDLLQCSSSIRPERTPMYLKFGADWT
jgi:hypothetical protein